MTYFDGDSRVTIGSVNGINLDVLRGATYVLRGVIDDNGQVCLMRGMGVVRRTTFMPTRISRGACQRHGVRSVAPTRWVDLTEIGSRPNANMDWMDLGS